MFFFFFGESKSVETLNRIEKEIQDRWKGLDSNQHIDDLSNIYKRQKICFVLGAGIGSDYGLPSWNELLQRCVLEMFSTEDDDSEFIEMYTKFIMMCFNPSSLISARYISQYMNKSKLSLEESVRNCLYKDIKDDVDSKIVKEIVNYCFESKNKGYLRSIITYNYDDIIENALERNQYGNTFKSIYKEEMIGATDQLPIYHVHGYLPRECRETIDCKIILGEDMYHKQYENPYSWNNTVQINEFRNNCCIFIGISFTDPNLRRLLEVANTKEKNKHYLFKKKYTVDEIQEKLRRDPKYTEIQNTHDPEDLNIDKRLIGILEKFEEIDAASLGVNIIWVESYERIPEILAEIKNEKHKNSNPDSLYVYKYSDQLSL